MWRTYQRGHGYHAAASRPSDCAPFARRVGRRYCTFPLLKLFQIILNESKSCQKNLPCLAPRRDIKERRALTLPGKMFSLPSPYSLSDAHHHVKGCFKKPPSRQLASKAGLPTDLVSSTTSHGNFPVGGSTSIQLFADLSTLPETNRSATCPNHAAWKHGRRCLRTSRGKGLV